MGKDRQEQPQHDLREGMPRGVLTGQAVPLAGGEPFIVVDKGPDIVAPSSHTTPGQTTHE